MEKISQKLPQIHELTNEEVSKIVEKIAKHLEPFIMDSIHEQLQPILRASKLREETLFSTLEHMQNSIKLLEKDISYKIGAIRGRQTRDEAAAMTTSSLEEALKLANQIRKQKGLPLIELNDIDPKSNLIDKPAVKESGFGKRI